MALHERADFRKLCGVENSYIKNYIDRGKIIVRADGWIDDKEPCNADFLRKQLEKQAAKTALGEQEAAKEATKPPKKSTLAPVKGAKNVVVKPSKTEKQVRSEVINTDQMQNNSKKRDRYDIETELKELGMQKIHNELRMQALKEEKMRGELIPYKLMASLIKANNTSVVTELKNFVDQHINIISIRKTLSAQEVAEIRGDTYKAINDFMDKAVNNTIENLDRISEEYALSKGDGV